MPTTMDRTRSTSPTSSVSKIPLRAATPLRRLFCACLIALACAASARSEGAYDLRRLVAEGDAFQNSGGEVIFRVWHAAANQRGVVAFTAEFGDPASSFRDTLPLGLFVQSDGASPRLLATLSETGFGNSNWICAINDRGTIAAAGRPGDLRVIPAQGQIRSLKAGDSAPFETLTFATIVVDAERFLSESDEVAFWSVLSDNRIGVFRFGPLGVRLIALQGELIQGSPDQRFGSPQLPKISGSMAVFSTSNGLFLDDGTRLRTILLRGQPLPEGGQFDFAIQADVNSGGRVGVAVQDSERTIRVLQYDQGELRQILDSSNAPPVPGRDFGTVQSLYVSEDGTIDFSAVSNSSGAIFRWREGALSTVVADGDPSPSGGSFEVSFSLEGQYYPIPPPFSRVLAFPRPNQAGDLVFEASAGGLDPFRRPFLSASGEMISLDFNRLPADESNRVIASLTVLNVDDGKRVLVLADLCCGGFFRQSLFIFEPAGPRRLWLPFLAGGGPFGDLEVATRLELANPTPYAAQVGLTPRAGAEDLFPAANFTVAGGEAVAVASQTADSYRRGFAEIDVSGGGGIQANATLRLLRQGELITQAGIAVAAPLQDALALIDQSDSADNGFAIANRSDTPSAVDLTLSDREGAVLGVRTIDLEPGQQVSRLATEIFEETREPDFLGALRIRTPSGLQPPLIASLRQSDLLISSVPVRPPPDSPPTNNLTGLFAGRPAQVLGDGSDTLFVAESQGGIRRIRREGTRVIVAEDIPLPEGETPSDISPSSVLLDFTAQGGLLFARRLENNRFGLYRWQDDRVEKVLVDGEVVDGVAVRLTQSLGAIDRNSRGRIVVGGRQLVAIDEIPRLLLTADTPIPGSALAWGTFERVIADEDNRIFFQSGAAVGVHSGDTIQLVARTGQASSTPDLVPESFLDIALTPGGDLLLVVSGQLGAAQGVAILKRRSQELVKLLADGDVVPGLPGFQIQNLSASLRMNSAGDAAVSAYIVQTGGVESFEAILLIPAQGDPRVFLTDAAVAAAIGAPPVGDFYFQLNFGEPLFWDEAGRLLFRGLDSRGRSQVLISDGHTVTPAMSAGDSLSARDQGRLITVDLLARIHGFFAGRVLAEIEAFDGSDRLSALVAAPLGEFREYFFPHAANAEIGGVQVNTRFLLSNQGSESARVEIDRFNRDGTLAGSDNLVLDSNRTRPFESEDAPEWVGWTRIRTTGGAVAVLARLSLRRNGRLVTETTVPESALRFRAALDTRFASKGQTALAIANPWDQPTEITLTLDMGDPAAARQETLALAARSQRAFFVADFFDGAEDSSEGRLLIRADAPVSMVSLRQDGLTLTVLPIE